jgi:peptidyl-tRNA hydrolase, PTH1 family
MGIAAVVGLGNPGPEYASTRHNLGFAVVDELARRFRADTWRHAYLSLTARRPRGAALLLVKPQTYMNESGGAFAALCRGEGLLPAECLVVVDDVELPLGQLRLRERGGAGSHNGMRSIVDAVGEDFPRLRLGIRGAEPWRDLADYVLAEFTAEETEAVAGMVARAADCVEAAMRTGIARAATSFNTAEPSVGEAQR